MLAFEIVPVLLRMALTLVFELALALALELFVLWLLLKDIVLVNSLKLCWQLKGWSCYFEKV